MERELGKNDIVGFDEVMAEQDEPSSQSLERNYKHDSSC
jgi:hypothetical protein